MASGPSRMVFEYLQIYFHLEDSTNGFPQLFKLCSHITQGHIPLQITFVLGITCLLIMTKHVGGVRCNAGNIVWINKPHFMFLIPQHFCNTFLPHTNLELQLRTIMKQYLTTLSGPWTFTPTRLFFN
jgi:hypothetical protein